MFTVNGNQINNDGSQSKISKQFSTQEEAEQFAEELDGFTIEDEDGEIVDSDDDSETKDEIGLDYLFPNRHDDDFDSEDMNPESFTKE